MIASIIDQCRTYGFILTVEDLSPNIGVLWWVLIDPYVVFWLWSNLVQRLSFLLIQCRYFFAEVFDFFRNFFLIVFHVNILFMMLPLAIRLNHRPCFLAFVYIAISSILKSYPSVSLPTVLKLLIHQGNSFSMWFNYSFISLNWSGRRLSPLLGFVKLVCQWISR